VGEGKKGYFWLFLAILTILVILAFWGIIEKGQKRSFLGPFWRGFCGI